MKLKNILCGVLAFCTFTLNAGAAVDISRNGKEINVTATIDAKATAVVLAVKDGHSAEETNYVVLMKEASADEKGAASITFVMPDETLWDNVTDVTGKYNVYVKQSGNAMLEGSFYYASESKCNELETALRDCNTSADLFKSVLVTKAYEDALKAEGFCIELYESLQTEELKNDVIEKAIESLNTLNGKTNKEIAAALSEKVTLCAINNADKAGVVKSALAEANLVFDNISYNAETEEKADWIAAAISENKPYSDSAALESAYEKVNILNKLNSTGFADLTALLAEYEQKLGIANSSEYKDYKASESKTSINTALASKLYADKPKTVRKLLDAIKACLPADTESRYTGGYTGSSPSGSGGGGFAAANMAPAVTPAATKKFSDIYEAIWAETAINAMADAGIIVGDGSGKFRPNDSVTREEFVKMVVMASGLYNKEATCDFSDVPKSAWYAPYIASAVNKGIIYGVTDTEFGSGQTLSRQDMAVICCRVLEGIRKPESVRSDVTFADEVTVSDYASAPIHKLYEAGLINGVGDNKFNPLGTATRAQTAQILFNIFLK